MSLRDKTNVARPAGATAATSTKATRRTMSPSSKTNQQQKQQTRATTQSPPSSSPSAPANPASNTNRRGKVVDSNKLEASSSNSDFKTRSSKRVAKSVIDSQRPQSGSNQKARDQRGPNRGKFNLEQNDESSSSSQEMTMTSLPGEHGGNLASVGSRSKLDTIERETNIDHTHDQETDDDENTTLLESSSPECAKRPASTGQQSQSIMRTISKLPAGWEEHTDKEGTYFWHVATGVIQRTQPSDENPSQLQATESLVLYHDDEEINQSSGANILQRRISSDDDDYQDGGAALTLADDPTTLSDAITFVVYPTGCCEFDETQLISANSTKAIQKCILKLTDGQTQESSRCWGLDQSQPILMRLLDDHIQFSDIDTHTLLRSQPIQTIKTWAVDDDNNFAFVIEDQHDPSKQIGEGDDAGGNIEQYESVEYALLNGPTFMCYVFSSTEDDDMSRKVAAKLNEEINRYRDLMSDRLSKSTRIQQMIDSNPLKNVVKRSVSGLMADNDQTDVDEDLDDSDQTAKDDEDDDEDDLEASSEMSMSVKYIGMVQVPRPMGIDVLNVAIDKSLADASKAQMNRLLSSGASTSNNSPVRLDGQFEIGSPLTNAKIHVSPSSVIIENEQTGDIIVECRIRYLTFMGISRRDIRWCGFIMQNTTNKTFEAHCIECNPTAGHVCEAIQASCSRMYAKMVKGQRKPQGEAVDVTKSSRIRDTLAKTFSKIKLTPIIQ